MRAKKRKEPGAWNQRKELWAQLQKRKWLRRHVSRFGENAMIKRGEDGFHAPKHIEFSLINRGNVVIRRALARRKRKPRRYVFTPLRTHFADKKRALYAMEFKGNAVAAAEFYDNPRGDTAKGFFKANRQARRSELKKAVKDFIADAREIIKRDRFLERMEKEFGIKLMHDITIDNVLVNGFDPKNGTFSLSLIDFVGLDV